MQDSYYYEYAVIRLVPLVEREEFVNIGLILFCKHQKYLRCELHLNEPRILGFSPPVDREQIKENLEALPVICTKTTHKGRLDEMDLAEKFRFVTAYKSSVIQTSRPHPGRTGDPEKTFERLFNELVL